MTSTREHDVVVVGGGPAGVVAALAAARNGANTLLIERYGFLGGAATAGYVNIFFRPHSSKGELTVGSIPLEILERIIGIGGATGYYSSNFPGEELSGTHRYSDLPFHPDMLKYLLDVMMEEAGVNLLFHTFTFDSIVENNAIQGVTVANKSGRQDILGNVVIDCTGDGDIAAWAGAPYEVNPKETLGHAALIFRLGGVNEAKVVEYMKAHSDQFMWGSNPYLPKLKPEEITPAKPPGTVVGFFDLVNKAKQAGEYVGRDRIVMSFQRQVSPLMKGVVTVNSTELEVDTSNADDWSRSEVEARKQLFLLVQFFKNYVPGFENTYLVGSAANVTPRETRRILGEYIFTEEDAMAQRRFHDVIGKGANGINIHYKGQWVLKFVEGTYDIPYRCLVPKRIENLLVAGRCISTTHAGMNAIRDICSCMVTGQATGTAAALSAKTGVPPRNQDVSALQSVLKEQGVLLETKY